MNLVNYITSLGVIAVLFVIFAESGLLIGFFFPGDSLLFTSGVLVNAGIININIHVFVALLFIAAVAGNSAGYIFGRKIGPKIFNRPDSPFFRHENITAAHAFYDKYGGQAIILAQFVPIIRTFAPIVAGVSKMSYKKFVTFSVTGALLWTAGVTYLGYSLGYFFKSIGIDIDTVLLPIIAVIVLASLSPAIYHLLKSKKNREAIKSTTKQQLNKLFKRSK